MAKSPTARHIGITTMFYEMFDVTVAGGWSSRRIINELRKGYRLEKPLLCPQDVYDIMCRVWHADPNDRPDFKQLQKELNVIIVSSTSHGEIDAASTNKLVEKLNQAKQNIRSATGATALYSTLGVDDDAIAGQPGRRSRISYLTSLLDVGFGRQRVQSDIASVSGNAGMEARPPGPSHGNSDYLALIGANGQPVYSTDVIPTVPPLHREEDLVLERVIFADSPNEEAGTGQISIVVSTPGAAFPKFASATQVFAQQAAAGM